MALGDGTGWNAAAPITTEPRADGADEIRDLRKGLEFRLNKEHVLLVSTAAPAEGGEHLEGSAKAYYEATAPANRPAGPVTTPLSAPDAGRLWVDSDDGTFHHYSGSAWVETGTTSKEGIFSGPDITDFNAGTGVTVDPGFVARWFFLVLDTDATTVLTVFAPVGLITAERNYRMPRDLTNSEAVKIKRAAQVITITKVTQNIVAAQWMASRFLP